MNREDGNNERNVRFGMDHTKYMQWNTNKFMKTHYLCNSVQHTLYNTQNRQSIKAMLEQMGKTSGVKRSLMRDGSGKSARDAYNI